MMLDAKLSRDKIEHIKTSNLTIDLSSVEQIDDVISKDGVQLNGCTIGKSGATISLTHEEIVSTACIFYEAGLETTSTALGFIGHILVNNQDIQEKIRQEVIDLHRVESKFDYNTVNQLKYMQCVIDETMRFYPPVTTFVSRTANEDYHYKNITIPKGATVRIPTEQLHHNEQYWPRHDQFDPERFRDKSAIDSVTFQPFGTGPRNCIGMRFAYYEMKLTLAKLLFKYRLVPGPSTEKELTIEYKISSQSPKNGVFVRALPL